ncbi:hypothetical protein BKA58DRAFT_377347 [Alternaria rosae]|uniref:uncharacterized protein n=1 Tax=Alternaria rosae TaxID=1187941 RepID=UPI001E8E23D6|nr:uncharacterized protein BKA58DRAFT_377347 [Alternaria rosae]KAH6878492.1 hypothetical protein BKA58DRAFT_377347 [Alternaria rosae]
MMNSASDHDGGDDQDEGRAFIDLSGPVGTSGVSPGDSSNGKCYTLPSNTSSQKLHNANQTLVPFLYVYEHHTCNPKLTFGPQSTLRLIREKKKSNDLVLYLKEVDGNAPVHVEYYRFKQGYTLRFNDCGTTKQKKRPKTADSSTVTTEEKKGKDKAKEANKNIAQSDTGEKKSNFPKGAEVLWYKEFHIYFPTNRWNTGFRYGTWTDDYVEGYGTYNEAKSKHNVVDFPRFVNELERCFKQQDIDKNAAVEETVGKDGKIKRKGRE